MAARYCFLDYDREIALVAELAGDLAKPLLGVGRIIANPDRDRASLTLLVTDAWQHQGLGSILTDGCLEIAEVWGVSHLVAETTADNYRMRQILRERGFSETVEADGSIIARREQLTGALS